MILKTDGSFAALVWTPDSCSGECYKLPADKQTPGEPPLELSTISTSHYSYHSDSEAAGGKAGLCRRMFYLVCKSSEAPLIKSLFIPKTCTYSTILSETWQWELGKSMTWLGTQLSGERWKAWRGGAGCCGLVGIIRKLIVMKRLHRAVYSAVHMARGYILFSSNM